MTHYRLSYWKTIVPSLFASTTLLTSAAALVVRAAGRGSAWPALLWAAWVAVVLVLGGAALLLALVAAGGLISLRRDTLELRGKPYRLPDSGRTT